MAKGAKGPIKLIIILVSVILGIPILLIGLVFILFYDSSHKVINVRSDYPMSEVFNDMMVDSLDNTVTNKEINIRLTQDALNQLLYNAVQDNAGVASNVIRGFYVEITDTNYNFIFEADALGFFKTKLTLASKLTIDDDTITFAITGIKLGRVGGFDSIAKSILDKVDDADLNHAFSSSGVRMKVDLKNLKISYALSDFYEDLQNAVTGDGGAYFNIFTEMVTSSQITTFSPNKNKAFEVTVDLDKLTATKDTYGLASFTNKAGYLSVLANNAVDLVTTYLDQGKISRDNTQPVTKYYVVGYDHLTSSEQNAVYPYLDNGTIAPASSTYTYDVPNDENLRNIAKDQIQSQVLSLSNPVNVRFTTDQIDRALSQSNIIGSFTTLTSKDEEGHHKVNYVTISRVSVVVGADNSLFFVVTTDINGYETQISLKTVVDNEADPEFATIKFKVSDMYLGSYKVSDHTKSTFMELITQSIDNGAFGDTVLFKADSTGIYVELTLKDLFASYGIIDGMGYETSFAMSTNEANNPGWLQISASH